MFQWWEDINFPSELSSSWLQTKDKFVHKLHHENFHHYKLAKTATVLCKLKSLYSNEKPFANSEIQFCETNFGKESTCQR